MKIAEVYGKNSNNKLLKSISSSGKTIFIDFKKLDATYLRNEDVTTTITVSINYKKINFDCQTWLDVDKNILMSPTYSITTNCSWLISSKFGSYISLNFIYVEVKSFVILVNFES